MVMTFANILQQGTVLAEGAVIERLRRDPSAELDPHILHAGFPFDPKKREKLAGMYREYLDAGAAFDIPMVVGTPTWRANPENTARALDRSCEEVNREAARFMQAIRTGYGPCSKKIFIGGLIGCRGDAYDPRDALSAEEAARFHEVQVRALAQAKVDFLFAATLPSASEAFGIAKAMAVHGIPYVLSFIIRPTGALLDGTPLREAVALIDSGAGSPPLCYWINCVHPSVFAEAMEKETDEQPDLKDRVIGLQANTSTLPPEALDNRPILEGEDPAHFAESMLQLNTRFGTKVLGGCCGTSKEHIRCIAEGMQGVPHG